MRKLKYFNLSKSVTKLSNTDVTFKLNTCLHSDDRLIFSFQRHSEMMREKQPEENK